ncbi:hypothetical protein Ocin01_11925 [Orchesella cincta]|uniref:Uncharacterized protein n=1 Tax=Orchesella cincta TaxID=48709 RepID=A0A1D2MPR7_ORCCI|nr:hypothetical protein Ocin01_11925 [Orchesella cincta]
MIPPCSTRSRFTPKSCTHNIDQKHAAENWLMSLDRKLTKFNYKPPLKRVRTDIEPVKHIFLLRCEENQHHLLQQDEFLSQVVNCNPKELVYSHLATKTERVISGYATVEEVEEQARKLGIEATGRRLPQGQDPWDPEDG